eukprot:4114575-Prymnesium_polylepis.1
MKARQQDARTRREAAKAAGEPKERKLPTGVQRQGKRFVARCSNRGKIKLGKTRATVEEAAADFAEMKARRDDEYARQKAAKVAAREEEKEKRRKEDVLPPGVHESGNGYAASCSIDGKQKRGRTRKTVEQAAADLSDMKARQYEAKVARIAAGAARRVGEPWERTLPKGVSML